MWEKPQIDPEVELDKEGPACSQAEWRGLDLTESVGSLPQYDLQTPLAESLMILIYKEDTEGTSPGHMSWM